MKTAKKTRKVLTNKANYMSDEAFADLKDALEEALAFERGERGDLEVKENPSTAPAQGDAPERQCSHPTEAQLLTDGVCDDAEYQPQNGPGLGAKFERTWDAALKLLTIAKKHPGVLLEV